MVDFLKDMDMTDLTRDMINVIMNTTQPFNSFAKDTLAQTAGRVGL